MNSLQLLKALTAAPEFIFEQQNISPLITKIDSLISHLTQLNLPVSLKKAQELKVGLTMNPTNKAAAATLIEKYVGELGERIEAELDGKIFYAFADHVAYLTTTEPLFGKVVDDAFPKTTEDISEAGKCLALGRPTASVFHLMRAMEISVQALYTKLRLTQSPTREWGKLLSDIDGAIKLMPKGDERDAWSASHSHLYHVKQAWRNDVMHPKQTYTLEEAKEVFDAVKSFMRHLTTLP